MKGVSGLALRWQQNWDGISAKIVRLSTLPPNDERKLKIERLTEQQERLRGLLDKESVIA